MLRGIALGITEIFPDSANTGTMEEGSYMKRRPDPPLFRTVPGIYVIWLAFLVAAAALIFAAAQ